MRLPNNVTTGGGVMRQNSVQNPYRIPPLNPRPSFDPPRHLPGFYISSEEDIVAGDVPMDGSISFFPYKDLSKIVIRQWNSDGDLEALTYVLDQPQIPQPQQAQVSQQPPQNASQGNETDAIVSVLSQISQGLNASFNQFGSTLQSIQQQINAMDQRYNILAHQNALEDDGGRG